MSEVLQVVVKGNRVLIYGDKEVVEELVKRLKESGVEVEVVVESMCG